MTYSERFTADLRRHILCVLAAAKVEVNIPILRASIEETTPHRPAATALRQELSWLAERDLVALRTIGASMAAATITERGEDLALGANASSG